jgi:predicted nucleic acid-binding protein
VNEAAVTDTGPPRHLAEIDHELTLRVFDTVIIPEPVHQELFAGGFLPRIQAALEGRGRVEAVTPQELSAARERCADFRLQDADLAVMAIAARFPAAFVLTDDLQVRKAAMSLGISVVGSIGVLLAAFHGGLLDRERVATALEALCDGSTLYLSAALRDRVREILDTL